MWPHCVRSGAYWEEPMWVSGANLGLHLALWPWADQLTGLVSTSAKQQYSNIPATSFSTHVTSHSQQWPVLRDITCPLPPCQLCSASCVCWERAGYMSSKALLHAPWFCVSSFTGAPTQCVVVLGGAAICRPPGDSQRSFLEQQENQALRLS